MYSIFSLILIIVSLGIIVFLIIRRFPQLALLDVEAIPEVKENEKKNELLRRRVEKKAQESKMKWLKRIKPLIQKLKEVQLAFRKYVGKVERTILEEITKEKINKSPEQKVEEAQSLQTMLQEANYSFEHEDWDGAEKKYIAAIIIDSKNEDAYYGLGQTYQKRKQLKEAEETFQFLLQLNFNHSLALARLAELAEESGRVEEAIGYYERCLLLEDSRSVIFTKIANLLKGLNQLLPALEAIKQAVELEPQNPKYLDNYLETSIMLGDKKLAKEIYQQLRMVNPENQKLVSFKERIEKIV